MENQTVDIVIPKDLHLELWKIARERGIEVFDLISDLIDNASEEQRQMLFIATVDQLQDRYCDLLRDRIAEMQKGQS